MTDTSGLQERLRKVSAQAAKLYARMVEMSRTGRGQSRSQDAAYLPELYEACGVTVEEMYAYIEELKTARLIDVEGEYPFEDAKIVDAAEAGAFADEAAQRKVSFSDAVVELQGNRVSGPSGHRVSPLRGFTSLRSAEALSLDSDLRPRSR